MLLWQLKNARNRYLLWLKLLSCSFAVHLLFVMIFFFGYRDGVSSHKFTMHNHSLNTQVTVVLAPAAHKPVANSVQTKQAMASRATKPTNQNKVATRMALLKPEQPKAMAKKTTPKTAPGKKTIAKTTPAKTIPTKVTPAKTEPTKTVQAKVEKPKITETKSLPEQKKEQIASKTIEKKVEPAITPVIAQNTTEKLQSQHVLAQAQNNGPTQIEIPYTQAREFYQQEALRKELSRHWTPPHGIPDTCSCEITTYVGNNGVVSDCVITQSSGILMYDVSARAAILAMELPRWTWGDSFAITFKP